MQKVDRNQYIHTVIGVILMFCGWVIPPVEPITEIGMQLVGIFLGLVYLWTTSGMLWPSLLGIAAMIISDYGTMNSVLAASFGNFSVWSAVLMMAIFGLIEQYGVNDYIVRWILTRKIINGRPWMFTFVWIFTPFFLAVLGAGFAAIFMFWALTYKLAEDLGYQKGDTYISLLLFGIVIGVAIASAILPFQPWILQISGIWQSMASASPFTYVQHLVLSLLISLVILASFVLLMRFIFKANVKPLEQITTDYFNASPLPPMNHLQKFLLLSIPLFILALFLSGVLPTNWGITKILSKLGAVGISLIVFVIFCCVRQDGKSIVDMKFLAGNKIAWDLAFLLACVMTISSALTADVTGVKPFLAGILNPIFGGMSPFVLFAVLLAVCIFLTNFANNGVIALLLLSITYITTASMDIPNIGYFVTMLAFASQTAFLIPGSSIYGALLHGNEWLEAKFIYKTTICVVILTYIVFLLGWPLSLMLY